jgi:hypothetical protein
METLVEPVNTWYEYALLLIYIREALLTLSYSTTRYTRVDGTQYSNQYFIGLQIFSQTGSFPEFSLSIIDLTGKQHSSVDAIGGGRDGAVPHWPIFLLMSLKR